MITDEGKKNAFEYTKHYEQVKHGCTLKKGEKTKAGSGNDKDEFYKIKQET